MSKWYTFQSDFSHKLLIVVNEYMFLRSKKLNKFEDIYITGDSINLTNKNAHYLIVWHSDQLSIEKCKNLVRPGDAPPPGVKTIIHTDKQNPFKSLIKCSLLGKRVSFFVDMKAYKGIKKYPQRNENVHFDSDEDNFPTSSSLGSDRNGRRPFLSQ